MEKLKMHSHDNISDNVMYIAERFPNVITESIGEDGGLVRSIDFDKLHQELTAEIFGEEHFVPHPLEYKMKI